MNTYKYLFGPVPSRRFGRSLGVDLLVQKTCCLDCVFCQLGRTRQKTTDRQGYVPVPLVLEELEDWLNKDGQADYITLSGSGEPTLHAGFGEVLEYLKTVTMPSVLLTNGTMLTIPEVRKAASSADIVKISLSAWDQTSFQWVNRPHETLNFSEIMDGLCHFRAQFKGEIWLEVFLLAGINAMPKNVAKIAAHAKKITADRIHLNTVTRPPAEDFANALPQNRMTDLTGLFEPVAEIINDFQSEMSIDSRVTADNILAMLHRRPCTIQQIAKAFGLHFYEASKYLGKLLKEKCIYTVIQNSEIYYSVWNVK